MILVVEDNRQTAKFLAAILPERDANLTLTTAGTLKEAAEVVRTTPIDAVLLDLDLPDATQIEALDGLRRAAPHVPVVVFSGLGGDAEEASMLAGADDYIHKGSPDQVSRIVSSLRHSMIRREVAARFAGARRGHEGTAEALRCAADCERRWREAHEARGH